MSNYVLEVQHLNCLQQMINAGFTTYIRVVGNSMYPTLLHNNSYVVHKCRPDDICIGDIVVCRCYNTHLTIHRVIELISTSSGLWIQTKGDNNNSPDGYYVPSCLVLGKVDI